MQDKLFALADLQELDAHIARIQASLAALDDGTDLSRRIAGGEARLNALRSQHSAKTVDQKAAEHESWRVEQKLDENKRRLESGAARGHRDVQGLQRNVEALTAQRGALDEKVLRAMDAVEAAEREIAELEERVAKARAKLERIRITWTSETARLDAEVAALSARRDEQARKVEPALLARYETIRARGGGVGLVVLGDPLCTACGTAVPTIVFDRLLMPTAVAACENCGRILVRRD